ncbi:hypothetical protein [Lachnospira multipara]|uniref:hypothetical protein n=1 Tax=Lachnospira multipara TaxID=28051 RepID=UPI0004856B71|nr:hypothetical protein [Lachnospira multipara]
MKYIVKKIIEPDYGCENSGRSIFDQFPEVRNSVEGGVAPRSVLLFINPCSIKKAVIISAILITPIY